MRKTIEIHIAKTVGVAATTAALVAGSLVLLSGSGATTSGSTVGSAPFPCKSDPQCDSSALDGYLLAGTEALVEVDGITVEPGSETNENTTRAHVNVTELLWETPIGPPAGVPDEGTIEVYDDQGTWVGIDDVLSGGGRVVLGLQEGMNHQLGVSMGLTYSEDPDSLPNLELVDVDPWLVEQFHAFLNLRLGGDQCQTRPTAFECAVEIVKDWNAEAHVLPSGALMLDGPISVAFADFWGRLDGRALWYGASPLERNMQDAPTEIQSAFPYAEVWVHVPESWKQYQDGAICLRISEGSNGCMHVGAAEAGNLVWMNAWAKPGEAMTVEARPLDPSWSEAPVAAFDGGIEIGTIPFPTVTNTGIVLVTLDPARPVVSYGQLSVTGAPAEPLAVARAITELELNELLALEPQSVPGSEI